MDGYMHHPNNWPPAPQINPLFVALHINTSAKEQMLSDDSIAYFKQYSPIGCRDYNTMNMLKEKGVDAYFSGCLTLTLGRKYKTEECDGKIYIVDPCCNIESFSLLKKISFVFLFLINIYPIIKLLKQNLYKSYSLKKRILHLTAFYTEYRKILSRKDLLSAEYINHEIPLFKVSQDTQQQYMDYAEDLVKRYSKAKLVITSRIHCALPCLGLETPVIYIDHAEKHELSGCRFGGLIELFNVAVWSDKGHLDSEYLNLSNSTTEQLKSFNSSKWVELCNSLTRRCIEFVEE